MAHAHGADAVSELRYRVERHQRPARGAHVQHRQGCRVALEPRFELEDHPVLVRRGIDVRNLAGAFSRSISTLTCGRAICRSLETSSSPGRVLSFSSMIGTQWYNSSVLAPCTTYWYGLLVS